MRTGWGAKQKANDGSGITLWVTGKGSGGYRTAAVGAGISACTAQT